MAAAFARFLGGGRVIIGRDTRPGSAPALEAVVTGLLANGCDVRVLGIAPTPAVFREVKAGAFDGGLSITASHNPPGWTGLKLVARGGRGLYEEEVERVKSLMRPGTLVVEEGSARPQAARYGRDLVEFMGDGGLGLRVALDVGGGAAYSVAPEVFRMLDCRVDVLNAALGVFSRVIDPTRDPLTGLARAVRRRGAQLALAFDADGDRVVILDSRGVKLQPDYTLLLGLMAYARLKGPPARLVASVDTTQGLLELAKSMGTEVVWSPVGEANVVAMMKRVGTEVGGEGSSGGLIIGEFNLCRDGLLGGVLVAHLLAEAGGWAPLLEELPTYHIIRGRLELDLQLAARVVEYFAEREHEAVRLDGVKFWADEGSWILLRPSRTEPLLRVTVEAPDRERAEALYREVLGQIGQVVKSG